MISLLVPVESTMFVVLYNSSSSCFVLRSKSVVTSSIPFNTFLGDNAITFYLGK